MTRAELADRVEALANNADKPDTVMDDEGAGWVVGSDDRITSICEALRLIAAALRAGDVK
jgi:hypothetical protein